MGEMRRLLGVLRENGDGAAREPLPGLNQIPALVERTRQAGIAVELEVDGPRHPLPASAELSVYRIVQEALTNVRKHTDGATTRVRLA